MNMPDNSFILCSIEFPSSKSCTMVKDDAANVFPIPNDIVWNKSILWNHSFLLGSCMRILVNNGSSSQGISMPIVAMNLGFSHDLSQRPNIMANERCTSNLSMIVCAPNANYHCKQMQYYTC